MVENANSYAALGPVEEKSAALSQDIELTDVELAQVGGSSNSIRRSIEDINLPEDTEMIDLDEDVYGAIVYTITFDWFELLTGRDYDGLDTRVNAYRMFFCLLLLIGNYCLQFFLLYIIYWYVAAPSRTNAQKIYKHYHAEVFVKGEFQQHLWEKFDGADDLCNIAFGNYWFMYAILGLWWISMVIEVRKTELLYLRFRSLENTTDPTTIITRIEMPDKLNLILNLTCQMRAVLYTIIIIPRVIIACGLLFVGTVWLAATDSFENLVLNSVALSFLINIDEIIFAGLVPYTMKKNINITKLVNINLHVVEGHLVQIVRGYRDSTLWLIFVIGGVAFYLSSYGQNIWGFGVFPGYLGDTFGCPGWWKEKVQPVCERGMTDCFKMS